MVVCKFFLQGTCRFGENCKFEHQINDGGHSYPMVLRQQNFANPNAVPRTNIDQNTLIKSVVNDMLSLEKGGQWLLSCYAPFKEKPNYPGFEEHSFEEIRWGFYNAQATGTVDQCKQQLQMLLQSAIAKIRSLQNPSPETINIIKNIYNSAPMFGNSAKPNFPPGNAFNTNQNSIFNKNVFAQAAPFVGNAMQQQNTMQPQNTLQPQNTMQPQNAMQPQNTMQAQNTMQLQSTMQPQTAMATSIFATANQAFFGPQQQAQQQGSIFANQPNTSTFANASPFAQAFNNQSLQNNPQSSLFQQQAGPGFAMQQAAAPFSQPMPSAASFFQQQNAAQPYAQQTAAPFANQQTANFNQGAPQTPFAAQPQASIFQQNQFNPQPASQAPFTAANSMFAQTPLNRGNVFAASPNQANVDPSIYSKRENLSEAEIKSFEGENFEFGKIPEKPPTIEMCF